MMGGVKQKKLLLLGGLRYLLPVIEAAHKLGYYVIIFPVTLRISIRMSIIM